jgi:thiol-disulfide isomerase/thioredoxin
MVTTVSDMTNHIFMLNRKGLMKSVTLIVCGILLVTFLQYITNVVFLKGISFQSVVTYGLCFLLLGISINKISLSIYDILSLLLGIIVLSIAGLFLNRYSFPIVTPGYIMFSSYGFYIGRLFAQSSRFLINLCVYTGLYALLYYCMPQIIFLREQHISIRQNLPPVYFESSDSRNIISTHEANMKSVVIIDYWIVGCGPCMEKFKALSKLKEKLGQKVTILAVDDGKFDTKNEFISFYNRIAHKKFPQLTFVYDPKGNFAQKLSVTAFPTEFLVDQNDLIVEKVVGYTPIYQSVYVESKSSTILNLLNNE